VSTGAILSETFSVYASNFVPFTIIATLFMSPLLAVVVWMATLEPRAQLGAALLALPVAAALQLVAQPVATAAMTYGVFQELRGGHAEVGDCLRVGFSCLLPVVGVALLEALAVAGGLLFCIVPGIVIATLLAVAVPAAVEERPGVLGALRRSSELTAGFRWKVFGVLFTIGGLDFVLGRVLGLLPVGLELVVSTAKDVLVMGVSATAGAVLYYRLRAARESVSVSDLGSIFA